MAAINPGGRRRPDIVGSPTVDRVGDSIAVARGFALGNVIKVATPEGSVVVDTSSTVDAAAAARDALQDAVPGDAAYVVYTHCHNDHTSGAEAFVTDRTEHVVAHDLLVPLVERDHGCLGRWTARHRAAQRGRPGEDPFAGRTFVPPSLTFTDRLELEAGGLTFRLEHTEGETRDHLLVWIPELRTLLPGDLVYPSFPNLSTPVIGPRPIEGWMRSLERFLELEPDHLVPSHGPPVSGRERVADVVSTYLAAIRYVWDASVDAIDRGVDLHTAARTITLPDELATHPWLRPIYGTVNWGVRAVYDRLTGWYDLSPATLNPLPRAARDAALVEAAGTDAIIARAEAALDADDPQLAVELVDVVLHAEPDHPAAWRLQHDACRLLRDRSTSANERGFYHAAVLTAREHL
jgi:alkyl sulfatase BDS1-like metallo-beta-lactamase superfamily hydrolase